MMEKTKKRSAGAGFFISTTLLVMLFEIIAVTLSMAVLRAVSVDLNMLSPVPIIIIGLVLCFVCMGTVSLFSKKRDVSFIRGFIAAHIIPAVIWGILTLITLTVWWSDQKNEDKLFFKWFALTMLIYAAIAAVFRLFIHLIRRVF